MEFNKLSKCKGEVLTNLGNKSVINCKSCKFAHLFPIPTNYELDEFYKNNYNESTGATNFKDRFETINSLFKNKDRRILDVGCWDGEQLQYYLDNGWKCVGIEPNKEKANQCSKRGAIVYNNMFDEVKNIGKFDVINLSSVLEHLPNPYKFMKQIRGLLNKNGMICVEVPNDYSEIQNAVINKYKCSDYWVHTPDHINYWNLKTIKQFLNKTGFKIELLEVTYPMEFFLLMGDNYIGDNETGKVCHKKRCNFEESLNNNLKRKIYRALGNIGIGRSFIIFARKK